MSEDTGPRLLAGGNPQIPKGDGDAPVAAYIAAMPGWKARVGRHIDAVVTDRVPGVRKAVRWNQPYYGAPDDDGWFLAFRCYTAYVQLQCFRGTELHPVPPKASRHEGVRYLDVREHEALDEALLRDWVEQAVRLPGVPL